MTEEKNSESESKEEQPKKERRFDPELLKKGLQCDLDQYDRLLKCSKRGAEGIAEWNQWRAENQFKDVLLAGADLANRYLQEANLGVLQMIDIETNKKVFGEVYLQGAVFTEAKLDSADLQHAHLEHATLQWASLRNASLMNTHLEYAKLNFVHLENSDISGIYLHNTDLRSAHLDGCSSGYTYGMKPNINRYTDFRGVDLNRVWIDPGTKILLKYNIRRMNWEDWYKQCKWYKPWQWPVRNILVRTFWLMSNYGISTLRIMLIFLVLAIAFAFVYSLWPCCVMVNNVVGDIRGFVHALYFSVVTMTTLGFGDIAANPGSWLGQVVLMVQVILGYVLLGALVTRLAVLFTSDGPAGSFTPMNKETKELLAKLKEDKGN